MPINANGSYAANHRVHDQIGNNIPTLEASEGNRPWGNFKPASWLPVQFFDKYYSNWFVTLPGKIVGFDNQGRVVPAQYGLASATITYTANDVTSGTLDVRTGVTLLIGAIGTFNVSAVSSFMGTGVAMVVGRPVGVSPYAYLQWSGDGGTLDDGVNPLGYKDHNYNMQHQVAILCDYVLELPIVPAIATTEAITETSNAANISTMVAVSNLPVATGTVRTPFTFSEGAGAPGDVATKFLTQKDTVAEVTASGDWNINLITGIITVYSTGAIGATDYELTYSHYASAPTGSSVSVFASALGDLSAGDFMKCNADSNWVVATPDPTVVATYTAGADALLLRTMIGDTFADIMGQVLEVENVLDKSSLGKVRTAYSPPLNSSAAGSFPAYAGQMDQMPGSATGGVSDKVHYAGASNLVVRINMVSR